MKALTACRCLYILTTFHFTFGAPLIPWLVTVHSIKSSAQVSSTLSCDVCEAVFSVLQQLVETETAEEDILKIATNICIDLKIEDKNVCESIVRLYKDEFFGVIDRVVLKPSEVCGVLIDGCGSPYNPINQTWTVPLPNTPKPPVKPIQPPNPNASKTRILHLSDVHVDLEYTPGLSNDCGEPLCCRPPNQKGVGKTAAGYWGDYNCDTPLWTFENLLQALSNKKDEFDWVYWTGDIPAHNVWNQSRDDQVHILKMTSDLIHKYLPDKPVFPSIGNHESTPCDSFPPPFITGRDSNEWLLNATVSTWEYWLPLTLTALATLIEGGYYSVKVREGLRVISLQTNYCNKDNWWLFINSTDPANQLHWLVQQLQSAEDAGEKVHIIGHIPPGHPDCTKAWSYNFYKIVHRYESTIIGQFYGHSHSDEIIVYYDEVNIRPFSYAMVGPSVTTYQNRNMGYKIYTIDGGYAETTSALLDFEVYYMNVSDARLTNKSQWILEYKANKVYGMEHWFPTDFGNLVKKFEQDDALFQNYYKFISRSHPPHSHCDSICKAGIICSMKSSRSGDHSLCTDLPNGLTLKEIHSMITERQVC